MMPVKSILAAITLITGPFLMTGCVSYPSESTVQGGQSSSLYFSSFPDDSTVLVNGVSVGPASNFDGANRTLAVDAGSHTVIVELAGEKIFEKKVYVGRQSSLEITR